MAERVSRCLGLPDDAAAGLPRGSGRRPDVRVAPECIWSMGWRARLSPRPLRCEIPSVLVGYCKGEERQASLMEGGWCGHLDWGGGVDK